MTTKENGASSVGKSTRAPARLGTQLYVYLTNDTDRRPRIQTKRKGTRRTFRMSLQSTPVFEKMQAAVEVAGEEIVKKARAVIKFVISKFVRMYPSSLLGRALF